MRNLLFFTFYVGWFVSCYSMQQSYESVSDSSIFSSSLYSSVQGNSLIKPIVEKINSMPHGSSIHGYACQITQPSVIKALQQAVARGVAVNILWRSNTTKHSEEAITSLVQSGCSVSGVTNNHCKAMAFCIPNDAYKTEMFLGSKNLTKTHSRDIWLRCTGRDIVEQLQQATGDFKSHVNAQWAIDNEGTVKKREVASDIIKIERKSLATTPPRQRIVSSYSCKLNDSKFRRMENTIPGDEVTVVTMNIDKERIERLAAIAAKGVATNLIIDKGTYKTRRYELQQAAIKGACIWVYMRSNIMHDKFVLRRSPHNVHATLAIVSNANMTRSGDCEPNLECYIPHNESVYQMLAKEAETLKEQCKLFRELALEEMMLEHDVLRTCYDSKQVREAAELLEKLHLPLPSSSEAFKVTLVRQRPSQGETGSNPDDEDCCGCLSWFRRH